MYALLTTPEVETLDGNDPALGEAVDLLGASVPQACAGLVAYHAAGYRSYLAAAVTPPIASRSLILRAIRGPRGLRAIADWRILPGQLFLNGVAVREDERGQGLGTRLLSDGRKLAERLLCRRLALDVSLDNPAAHRLYLSHGFTELSRSRWRDVYPSEHSPAALRLINWPFYVAHRNLYGFGDLAVRAGIRDMNLRIVGTATRVPAVADADALAAAVTRLLPVKDYYLTESAEDRNAADGRPIRAEFLRMSSELPESTR
ncbi:GNAT family N-acetyltransferase [Verrucosispora sp. WMMD703]|uniref:GNAT family N-acetyltransferase n=1 Tax=unclassified Micromonospora TaxID=2617518 RepID=UPI00249BC702|nr:GNAT family N-acetyltransferase [Verrucosispora sp. WMMD1129]WFE43948.1 GNAT family N-acetyltransferase [Verrucosispora sp. WMMD1129]